MAATAQAQAVEPSPLRQVGHRFLEASPGLVTWTMLFCPAWIPILFGTGGAIVVGVGVLMFDLYWLFRSYSIITGIYQTYSRMTRDMNIDWLQRCRDLAPPDGSIGPLDYYHLAVIPTYTEPYHVLEATVQAIVDAEYPARRARLRYPGLPARRRSSRRSRAKSGIGPVAESNGCSGLPTVPPDVGSSDVLRDCRP